MFFLFFCLFFFWEICISAHAGKIRITRWLEKCWHSNTRVMWLLNYNSRGEWVNGRRRTCLSWAVSHRDSTGLTWSTDIQAAFSGRRGRPPKVLSVTFDWLPIGCLPLWWLGFSPWILLVFCGYPSPAPDGRYLRTPPTDFPNSLVAWIAAGSLLSERKNISC